VTARGFSTTLPALLATLLVLGGCDGCGRASPSAPSSASPSNPGVLAPAAAAPAALAASEVPSVASSPESRTAVGAGLVVPATQIFEPSDLAAGERRPLLVFLHGLGASGKIAFEVLHLAAFGARERVFVVAPDGNRDRQKRQFWNAGPACCNFDRQEIDDVARLGALLDSWRSRPGVDPSRIYLMGHSNGGFMTERLACALGDRITAAASLSGAAPGSDEHCTATRSLALLEVHGDADEIVRYAGGSVFDASGLAPFPGAEQGFRDWGKRLGCSGPADVGTALDLDPTLSGTETTVQQYARCPSGSVALWTVHGGSHFVGTGQPAFEAIWRFLSAHHS
jgi:polyhydroxybutyrate depolymerase